MGHKLLSIVPLALLDFYVFYFLQDDVDASILVAGLATTCSQKIHNQLVCDKFVKS